jgi:hypothetical protein
MPERDERDEQLRRELLRQAPRFELGSSLPNKVSGLVRRRQRVRLILAVAAAAAVVVAVAIPLSALRSEPLGRRITPATTPTSTTPASPTTSTAATAVALPPLACGALDLWTTPTGTPVITTATLGRVTVSLSGTAVAVPGTDPALSNAALSIVVRDGGHFSENVTPPAQTNSVIPWSIAPRSVGVTPKQNSDALCLVNFPDETMPTILLGLDTGGAHCCTVLRTVALSPVGPAPAVDDDLGNPGASVSADGDYAMIVTADNAFAYAFASYARSGMPLEVVQARRGSFLDITREHPDLVTRDASTWWTAFTSNPGFGLGALSAWVADQCNLGQGTAAWTTVDQLQAQGRLSGPAGWPQGAAYVQALKSFLAQHGYCPS